MMSINQTEVLHTLVYTEKIHIAIELNPKTRIAVVVFFED